MTIVDVKKTQWCSGPTSKVNISVFRFPKFRFPVGLPVFKYRLAPNLGPQKESYFRDQREN